VVLPVSERNRSRRRSILRSGGWSRIHGSNARPDRREWLNGRPGLLDRPGTLHRWEWIEKLRLGLRLGSGRIVIATVWRGALHRFRTDLSYDLFKNIGCDRLDVTVLFRVLFRHDRPSALC